MAKAEGRRQKLEALKELVEGGDPLPPGALDTAAPNISDEITAQEHVGRMHRALAEADAAGENGSTTGAIPTLRIELPVDESVPATTWGIHVDLRLSPEQSLALRRVAAAADAAQLTLLNGRRITTPADALRYILERFADAPYGDRYY